MHHGLYLSCYQIPIIRCAVQNPTSEVIDMLLDIAGKLPKSLQYRVVFIHVHTLHGYCIF